MRGEPAPLRLAVAQPTIAYRKQYPGGGEPSRFVAGPGPAVLEVDGWRLGLAICRDSGVEQHAADTADLDIDVYVVGAVDHPHEDVVQEQRALRICAAHQVWVAFASFAGPTGGGYARTAGRSGIWRPGGRVVDRTDDAPGSIARAVLGTDV